VDELLDIRRRLAGIAVLIAGVLLAGTAGYRLVEGDLSVALRRRRMGKGIAALKDHYVVRGGGHAGGVIINDLRKTGRLFVLVDKNPETIEKMKERQGADIPCIVGDATDDVALKAAGVERAAGVFAVLATDQDNAFVALSAKAAGVSLVMVGEMSALAEPRRRFGVG
jgi:voltage-gated potassium channel